MRPAAGSPVMTPRVPSLPTNSWVRSGPVAARGASAGVHHLAVGQDDLEPDHHVLDLAVPGRVLAGGAARQPPSDRRQLHRLGPVPEGDAVARSAARLRGPRRRCPHPRRRSTRRVVDRGDAGQAAQIEADAAEDGDAGAAHPAAAGHRGHRHPGLVAQRQHRRHLGGVGRTERRPPAGRAPCPAVAHMMASGHQSRPASTRDASSVSTLGHTARRRSSRPVVDLDPPVREAVPDPRRWRVDVDRRDGRGPAGHDQAALAAGVEAAEAGRGAVAVRPPARKAVDLALGLGGRPSQLGGEQAGDVRPRRPPRPPGRAVWPGCGG